jgi:RNAse (barnase) inhibitor barstar
MAIMDDIFALLKGDRDPGMFRITTDLETDVLAPICEEAGWQLFVLDGEKITNKAEFLQTCAIAMKFPEHFGQNWDAFYDCITDLDWAVAKGYLLVYTQPEAFAHNHPADWSTLLELLQDGVDDWAETESPLVVVFKTREGLLSEIEEL